MPIKGAPAKVDLSLVVAVVRYALNRPVRSENSISNQKNKHIERQGTVVP